MLNKQEIEQLANSIEKECREINGGLNPLLTATAAGLNMVADLRKATAFMAEISLQRAEVDRLNKNLNEGYEQRNNLLLEVKNLVALVAEGNRFVSEDERNKRDYFIQKAHITLGAKAT